MLDAAMGEWRAPDRADAGWRDCLEAAARGLRQQFRRHPWPAPALSLTRPAIVTGGIGWTEWVVDALAAEDMQLPALRAIAATTGHPHVIELLQHPYDLSLDRFFERGLRYFLDGLSVEINGSAVGRDHRAGAPAVDET